jgi:hypothetical protein
MLTCHTVMYGCVRIPQNIEWSMFTKNGCTAPCSSSFKSNIVSQISDCTLSFVGYRISPLYN